MAPVHDALMLEVPADSIDEIVARTQQGMAEASAVILDGFRLRSDASIVRWPGRFMDTRGRELWGRVLAFLLAESEADRQVSDRENESDEGERENGSETSSAFRIALGGLSVCADPCFKVHCGVGV
jgi:hypothetical protein